MGSDLCKEKLETQSVQKGAGDHLDSLGYGTFAEIGRPRGRALGFVSGGQRGRDPVAQDDFGVRHGGERRDLRAVARYVNRQVGFIRMRGARVHGWLLERLDKTRGRQTVFRVAFADTGGDALRGGGKTAVW